MTERGGGAILPGMGRGIERGNRLKVTLSWGLSGFAPPNRLYNSERGALLPREPDRNSHV